MPEADGLTGQTCSADEGACTAIVKVVNAREEGKELNITLHGGQWNKVEILAMEGYQPEDRNSFENPLKVVPVEKEGTMDGNGFEYLLPGNSMAVFHFIK